MWKIVRRKPSQGVGRLVVVALCVLTGCVSESPVADPATAPPAPTASVALRVLVVNEPEMAEAIERLKGEWAERGGGVLTAASRPWAEIMKTQAVSADFEADLIVFPSRYLGELAARGSLRPVRRNVLESDEYDAADVFPLARYDLVTWGGQVMALAIGVELPTRGVLVDLAPAAVMGDRLGDLFDPDSMKPRITETAFVKALSQPDAVAAADAVPVLGREDRLVSVLSGSRNAASAFQLLAWLASADTSTQLAQADGGMLPVRRSLASSPGWYDSALTAGERDALAKRLVQALSGERRLILPRIPGIDEYLAALEVLDQYSGDPAQGLAKVASQWEAITDRLGREKQRDAYVKHLNISEP